MNKTDSKTNPGKVFFPKTEPKLNLNKKPIPHKPDVNTIGQQSYIFAYKQYATIEYVSAWMLQVTFLRNASN